MKRYKVIISALMYNMFSFNYSDYLVDIGRVRKEMEVEVSKLERDVQLLNQKMIQAEREAQVSLKNEQQSHEEDLDKSMQDKVSCDQYFIQVFLCMVLLAAGNTKTRTGS